MSELLVKKQYLVGITIIEARDIFGKDDEGTSDPFVKVKVADQVQQGEIKYQVNSGTWQQSMTFSDVRMNEYELETFEMIIELYDHNSVVLNELIGQYSIGLSTLHRALNHEFYRTWVGMFHPEEPNKVQAYLQISAFIVGPGDIPPAHSSAEDFADGELDIEDDDDEETIIKKIELMKRAQGAVIINNPNFARKNYQLTIAVGKAENIAFDPTGSLNPFISARVNGLVLLTKTFYGNQSPPFSDKLQFPIFQPILNQKITVRLWSNSGAPLTPNYFIANLPEQPSPFDHFNISEIMKDSRIPAKWINLYGPDPKDRGVKTKGRRQGSMWLGRVLMSFGLVPSDRPTIGTTPCFPLKEPKSTNFQLYCDLFEYHDIKFVENTAMNIWIMVQQGPKKKGPFRCMKRNRNKDEAIDTYEFVNNDYLQVEPINNVFPLDFAQIPDIFIHIYANLQQKYEPDDEKEPEGRIGYIRIPAIKVARPKPFVQWYNVKSISNEVHSHNLGMIMANLQFVKAKGIGGPNDLNIGLNKAREKIKHGKKVKYQFLYQILSGFELATHIKDQDLKTKVVIRLGSKIFKTKVMKGRYPQYNAIDSDFEVKLESNLMFQHDMRVQVMRVYQPTGLMASNEEVEEELGGFSVSVQSISQEKHNSRPQFFNILNADGSLIGQVLCNFHLETLKKVDPEKYKRSELKKANDQLQEETHKKWKSLVDNKNGKVMDLNIALFALRNLTAKCIDPIVTLYLTNNPAGAKKISTRHENCLTFDMQRHQVRKQNSALDTTNPNYCDIINFENIKLPADPLLWPFLVINIKENPETKRQAAFLQYGCEETYTTIPLLQYARQAKMVNKQEYKFVKAQFSRNQSHTFYNQNLISEQEALDFAAGMESSSSEEMSQSDDQSSSCDSDDESDRSVGSVEGPKLKKTRNSRRQSKRDSRMTGRSSQRRTVMPNGMAMKVANQRISLKKEKQKNLYEDWSKWRQTVSGLNRDDDIEDWFDGYMYQFARENGLLGGQNNIINPQADLNFEQNSDDDDFGDFDELHKEHKGGEAHDLKDTGILIGVDEDDKNLFGKPDDQDDGDLNVHEIKVQKLTKVKEKTYRKITKERLRAEIKIYNRKLAKIDKQIGGGVDEALEHDKRVVQMHLFELKEKIDELDREEMTEQRFWGVVNAMAEYGSGGFEYNREIIHNQAYDRQLERRFLPYENIPLFLPSKNSSYGGEEEIIVNVKGIMRSGLLAHARLKASLRLSQPMNHDKLSKSVSFIQDKDKQAQIEEKRRSSIGKKKKKQNNGDKQATWESHLDKLEEIVSEFHFNITHEVYLNELLETARHTNYKVRVYILSGNNITALNNVIDIKSMLAGQYAMCTSSPYPEISVGDGITDPKRRITKSWSGRDFAVESELNPEFLQAQVLDVPCLAEDWKLHIKIMDRSGSFYRDQMIGETIVDLEARHHGDLLWLSKKTLEYEKERIEQELRDARKRAAKNRHFIEKQEQKKRQIQNFQHDLKAIDYAPQPIEYRELTHPLKTSAQGMLEMFTEVMTAEEARKLDMSKIKKVTQKQYQIRLVIWETREVPLVDGDSVDIYVKVQFNPTGWAEDLVEKRTDNHNHSTDGLGEFNWRMLFNLKMPCQFPRLKFQIYDANLTADEAIGEKQVDLRRTLQLLEKEEKVSIPKTLIQMEQPHQLMGERGLVLFSLDILPLEDAQQDPVGEAQNEPNKDPFLKTPTAGRGLGDAIAGVGLSLPEGWNFNFFGQYTIVIVIVLILMVILVIKI